MARDSALRYDLYLGDKEVRRDITSSRTLHREDLLLGNRWIVTDVLPAPENRVDYEVFARRVRPDEVLRPWMTYLAIKRRSSGVESDSYASRQPLAIGMHVVLGIEKWVIREIRPPGPLVFFDGVIIFDPEDE
jgi:hypothetical protein